MDLYKEALFENYDSRVITKTEARRRPSSVMKSQACLHHAIEVSHVKVTTMRVEAMLAIFGKFNDYAICKTFRPIIINYQELSM